MPDNQAAEAGGTCPYFKGAAMLEFLTAQNNVNNMANSITHLLELLAAAPTGSGEIETAAHLWAGNNVDKAATASEVAARIASALNFLVAPSKADGVPANAI